MARAKINKITLDIEYSDGQTKEVYIDPNEYEAIFWSDRAVEEILAPFYKEPKIVPEEDRQMFRDKLNCDYEVITPDVVLEMWNAPHGDKDTSDQAAVIKKSVKCIPHKPVMCKHIACS
ncbi:hypothetical protein QNZ96_004568 [Vibrio parahaemolyticus]|nr:hypothetical protein [Vibrio parahaemolyticus]